MYPENISETIQKSCQVCQGTLVFDVHADESICSKCGIVFPACDEFLHYNTCTKVKDVEQQPVVESLANTMMYEISLPTFIGKKNIDSSGRQIRNYHIDKMRKLDRFTFANDNKMRNLNKAVREIQRITEILGMKSLVAERATYIYRKAFGQGLIRGRSISGIAAAAIYVACKEREIPFSADDIEKMIDGLSKKNILRYYKMLLKCMKISLGLPSPLAHISKIAGRTGLSVKTERKALEILAKIGTNSLLCGKKPVSIAAAALYIASLQTCEHTTQLRIAMATDLTTITIRNRCSDIKKILKDEKSAELVKIMQPTIDSQETKAEWSKVIQMPI
ncbi:MAG: transcription initiation factor IIB family protein [Nitrososphaerales archaeon]